MDPNVQSALMIVGLGARRAREGFGDVGPYGNVPGDSVIQPGDYQITGSGVAMRNPLSPGLPSDGSVVQRLNTGDVVTTDASSFQGTNDAQGQFVNFAFVALKSNPSVQGYVAVEYLAPAGTITPAPVANVSSVTTTDTTHSTTTSTSTSTIDTVKNFITTHSTPILIGAGVVGAGIIALALMSKKGHGKGRRRHSTHRHAHHH
jgi:hypothetical protein